MPTNDSLLFDAEPIRKRSLVMIIIVDTSGSMYGARIGAVNTALEELLPALEEVGEADAEIKLAILTFSDVCSWLTPAPMAPQDFRLEPLEADGLTCLGMACKELSKRMSRKDLFSSPGSSFAPILILMSDGEPTDDYRAGIEEIKNNKWFREAFKYALPIGAVMDTSALEAFTGSKEAVLRAATSSSDLIKKIKMVALESAKFATVSHHDKKEGEPEQSRQDMILKAIDQQTEEEDTSALGVDANDDDGDEW